jgi:hypothetical protein
MRVDIKDLLKTTKDDCYEVPIDCDGKCECCRACIDGLNEIPIDIDDLDIPLCEIFPDGIDVETADTDFVITISSQRLKHGILKTGVEVYGLPSTDELMRAYLTFGKSLFHLVRKLRYGTDDEKFIAEMGSDNHGKG